MPLHGVHDSPERYYHPVDDEESADKEDQRRVLKQFRFADAAAIAVE